MPHTIVRNDSNSEDTCTMCGKHEPHLLLPSGRETTCIDSPDDVDDRRTYSPIDPSFVI